LRVVATGGAVAVAPPVDVPGEVAAPEVVFAAPTVAELEEVGSDDEELDELPHADAPTRRAASASAKRGGLIVRAQDSRGRTARASSIRTIRRMRPRWA
jgi:hypothetical protein